MYCVKPDEHPYVPSAKWCPECRRERQARWRERNRKARALLDELSKADDDADR